MNRAVLRALVVIGTVFAGGAAGAAWSYVSGCAVTPGPTLARPGDRIVMADLRPIVVAVGEIAADVPAPCALTLVNGLGVPLRVRSIRSTCPCIEVPATHPAEIAPDETWKLDLRVVLSDAVQQSLSGVIVEFDAMLADGARPARLVIAPRAWTPNHSIPAESWEGAGR